MARVLQVCSVTGMEPCLAAVPAAPGAHPVPKPCALFAPPRPRSKQRPLAQASFPALLLGERTGRGGGRAEAPSSPFPSPQGVSSLSLSSLLCSPPRCRQGPEAPFSQLCLLLSRRYIRHIWGWEARRPDGIYRFSFILFPGLALLTGVPLPLPGHWPLALGFRASPMSFPPFHSEEGSTPCLRGPPGLVMSLEILAYPPPSYQRLPPGAAPPRVAIRPVSVSIKPLPT